MDMLAYVAHSFPEPGFAVGVKTVGGPYLVMKSRNGRKRVLDFTGCPDFYDYDLHDLDRLYESYLGDELRVFVYTPSEDNFFLMMRNLRS